MSEISVILPVFNRQDCVGRAMKSVLEQTFEDFELLVVDDGSTDDTWNRINAVHDGRIRRIRHEINLGVAQAKNTGVKEATSAFLTFQDSDDVSLPNRLMEEYMTLSSFSKDVGMVYCGVYRSEWKSKYLFPVPRISSRASSYRHALNYGVYNICSSSCLIRKEVFDKVGSFDSDLDVFVDFEFFIRFAKSFKVHYINKPLVIYNSSRDSVTKRLVEVKRAKIRIYRKFENDIKADRMILSRHLMEIGHSYCLTGRLRMAGTFFALSVKNYPLNVKAYVYWLLHLQGGRRYRALFYLMKRSAMRLNAIFCR